MSISQVAMLVLVAFGGYILGRIGHCYFNVWLKDPWWAPDHWVYGILLMILGVFLKGFSGLLVFSFGFAHLISDWNDFMKLKLFGKDADGKKKFWSID